MKERGNEFRQAALSAAEYIACVIRREAEKFKEVELYIRCLQRACPLGIKWTEEGHILVASFPVDDRLVEK